MCIAWMCVWCARRTLACWSSTGKAVSIGFVLPAGDFSDCDAAVAQASGRCAGAGGTFSGEAIDGSGRATKIFDGRGVASLQVAAWAGNVRELRTLSGTMTKVDDVYINYL